MKYFKISRFALFSGALAPFAAAAFVFAVQHPVTPPTWNGLGKNAQHTANQTVAAQHMTKILWQTPVDLNVSYSGSDLLTHYGSILITSSNTIILPVKTGLDDGFQIEAHRGSDGLLLWMRPTTYSLPAHGWIPSCGPTLLSPHGLRTSMAWPESGGRLTFLSNPDASSSRTSIAVFYGAASYNADSADFDANVKISTPLTAGPDGSVYFGYRVTGNAPLIGGGQLASGFARVDVNGNGTWVAASTAANDGGVNQSGLNTAPAMSNDSSTVYFVANSGGYSAGDLVGVDSQTLATKFVVRLKDPVSQSDAGVDDDGTASPMVAPDGDVYMGVLENPFGENGARGWLLHFDSTLSVQKTGGAFGWDDTPSIVPKSAVPFYRGKSAYLVMTKYNNYAGFGNGDGVNRVALLDPNLKAIDQRSGQIMMGVVASQIGPTPDVYFRNQGYANAVREWCVNNTAIDPIGKCAIVNCEDGHCYRWDFTTNKLTDNMTLTGGIGEAYTSTVIGPNGVCYAVNNAVLFALGTHP